MWHKILMPFSHSRFFCSKNSGSLLIRLSIERLGEQMADMQWIIFASSKSSLFNTMYAEDHAPFEVSHWAGKSEGSESIKQMHFLLASKRYVYSISNHKGWVKCVLLNTKSPFPSLTWVKVTQVNLHWRKCMIIHYLWKILLFPCVDILRGGKVKRGKSKTSPYCQIRECWFCSSSLYTTEGLQNAMGLTLISKVLCLHQTSWVVRNHFSTEALD